MAEGCCCTMKKHNDKDLAFRDASRRLNHELDICEVIKTIRVSRLLAKTQTTSQQRELVKYLNKYTAKPTEINQETDAQLTDQSDFVNKGSVEHKKCQSRWANETQETIVRELTENFHVEARVVDDIDERIQK